MESVTDHAPWCSCRQCEELLATPETVCELVHGDPDRFGVLVLPPRPEVETPGLLAILESGCCPDCGSDEPMRLHRRLADDSVRRTSSLDNHSR